ncbi:MAG: HK97 gp10 family phage protein [Bacteroidota bacterium]
MEMSGELEGVEETLKKTEQFIKAEERAVKEALENLLRLMVNYVKDNGPWQDRTANLRNSISVNIKEMKEWDSETDPSVLRAKATSLEKPVVKVSGDDYEGAISAGMEYAIWVELKSGYWVLQGAIDKFEPLIDKYLSDYLHVDNIDLEEIAEIKYAEQFAG